MLRVCRCRDIQHSDTFQDTQHNGIRCRVLICWGSFLLRVIYAEGYLCWGSFLLNVVMLSVIYAECCLCLASHIRPLCWVSLCCMSWGVCACMLVCMYVCMYEWMYAPKVPYAYISITSKPLMLNVVMLNVVMLNVVMLNVVMLYVMARVCMYVFMFVIVSYFYPSLIFAGKARSQSFECC